MNNVDKLKELFSDQKLCENLFALESNTDVQSFLNENGIALTLDEIDQIKDLLIRYQNEELTDEEKKLIDMYQVTGELSEEDLENVAGGEIVTLGVVGVIAVLAIAGVSFPLMIKRVRW